MHSLVKFDITSQACVDEAFDKIRWNGSLHLGQDTRYYEHPFHVRPLLGLKHQLDASNVSLYNADGLGKGHKRLLVVLLEPSNQENEEKVDEAWEWPQTLQEIDWLLDDASRGRLNMMNTCIFDIRPLRFRFLRDCEPENIKAKHDELAYQTFQRMVFKLQPDVIVTCQCDSFHPQMPLIQMLCSKMSHAGEAVVRDIGGKPTTIVYGFHPSNYLHEQYLTRYLRDRGRRGSRYHKEAAAQSLQDLLRYTFHVAINALAGRQVVGPGLDKLRHACLLPPPVIEISLL